MNKSALEFRDIKSLLGKKKQAKYMSSMPFLSLLTLTACGGGSGTTDTSDSGDSTPTTTAYSGSVIKGPLQNALVFLDYDGDGVLGADEPSVRTASDGSFSVDGTMSGVSFVAQTDSTTLDTSSGEILDNVVLKAPSGSTVVTPATTIMKEAGITKEEVSAVLGLPAGVDPTSFNPYSADADPETALAVEKVSQQVMTTITAVSSAVEGAGADKAAAFAVALETVVEIVQEKAAVIQADPEAEVVQLDFSNTEEIQAVTAKVSTKIEEQGIATKEDFDAVKADLDVAVTNVNTKINEVTDLTSEDSMAAFAVATELKTQVKAAVEAKGDPEVSITFTDVTAIETAQAEKATEIAEKIESGLLGINGADVILTRFDNIQSAIDSATDVDGNGSIVIALSSGEYNQSFTVNRDVEIWGARKGEAISKDGADADTKVDEVSEVFFDIYDGGRESGDPETWINGTVTVASDDVTLDGLRLHSFNGPLDFAGTDIDNFSLLNSYVTGFKGQNSLRYQDTDGTASTGWTIDGNLIGGVSAGVGGSLYLTGVDASTISDNVFWRPGASHMYLEDVSGLTIEDNFFVQGLHADGANSDGTYNSLTAFSNWGYENFTGGDGYGTETLTGAMTDLTYYGRNYIAEVKGETSDVNFSGNTAKFNSGGIQFWDEDSTSNHFTNITIENNVFTDFLNADPEGFLDTAGNRHETGIMGGVTYSVVDGSSSTGLTIKGNTFEGAIDQIHNDNDIDSLILVQGGVESVNISDNTLEWKGSKLSDTHADLTGGTTSGGYVYKVYTQGIHLAGDVNGGGTTHGIALQNNVFNTDDVDPNYASDAVLLDANDYSSLNLGTLSSGVTIVDNGSVDLPTYAASADFGGYNIANDELGDIMTSGTYTGTVLFSMTDVM